MDHLREAMNVVDAVAGQAERIETPCGDGTMIWRVWGRGAPIVLLHGGFGSWTHWLRNIPELSATFRVVAPDMPGFGDSAAQPARQTLDALAATMADGLPDVVGQADRFALVGFSFGGIVAGHLAAMLRESVTRLVLLGAGGLALPRPSPPELARWREIPDEAGRREVHRRNLAAVMLANPSAIDPLALHLQAENTRRSQYKSRPNSLGDSLRGKLEALHLPLGGIWGEHDVFTGPFVDTRRAYLSSLDPGCPFVVVPGAGHWVQYERPAEVNAALREMLAAPE